MFNFVIGFDSDCYEAGMVEILKEIADEELINHPFIELSAPTKGLIKKAEQSLKIIKGNT